jgi:hypothetical protein
MSLLLASYALPDISTFTVIYPPRYLYFYGQIHMYSKISKLLRPYTPLPPRCFYFYNCMLSDICTFTIIHHPRYLNFYARMPSQISLRLWPYVLTDISTRIVICPHRYLYFYGQMPSQTSMLYGHMPSKISELLRRYAAKMRSVLTVQ